jgi:hypothetical protein
VAVVVSDRSRIVVAKEQVSCDLAGEAAILDLKNGVYYGLDPVGARVWNLVRESTTFAELRDTLLREYDIDAATLESDLRGLLEDLAERGLVEVKA